MQLADYFSLSSHFLRLLLNNQAGHQRPQFATVLRRCLHSIYNILKYHWLVPGFSRGMLRYLAGSGLVLCMLSRLAPSLDPSVPG